MSRDLIHIYTSAVTTIYGYCVYYYYVVFVLSIVVGNRMILGLQGFDFAQI